MVTTKNKIKQTKRVNVHYEKYKSKRKKGQGQDEPLALNFILYIITNRIKL